MSDAYLYHHAMRAERPLSARVRWWIRFKLPRFAADLSKATVLTGVIAIVYSVIGHI